MLIDNKFKGTESLITFQEWWIQRISPIEGGKRPGMPDFFEVWNARQPVIDELRKENDELKEQIQNLLTVLFGGAKPNG